MYTTGIEIYGIKRGREKKLYVATNTLNLECAGYNSFVSVIKAFCRIETCMSDSDLPFSVINIFIVKFMQQQQAKF